VFSNQNAIIGKHVTLGVPANAFNEHSSESRLNPTQRNTPVADLRIFSYLPNPRLAKAIIAAKFSGADIEIVGDNPPDLLDWLWDFDARKLSDDDKFELSAFARTGTMGFAGRTIYKSDAFLRAHPFGNVPAGFSADGSVGIFESNSIMRAAARCGSKSHGLLGVGPMGESRVDAYLDRSLVFACDSQRYLLAGDKLNKELHTAMSVSLTSYATGLNTTLEHNQYLAGDEITLADIAAACELGQLTNEFRYEDQLKTLSLTALAPELANYPQLGGYLQRLAQDDRFWDEIGSYLEKLLKFWGRSLSD
jgi:glutathione S-transferase